MTLRGREAWGFRISRRVSGNHSHEPAWTSSGEEFECLGNQGPERVDLVSRGDEEDDRDGSVGDVLLKLDALIHRDEGIELLCRCTEQLTFSSPDQPASATVTTSCPMNDAPRRLGTHSSRSSRTDHQLPGDLEHCDGLIVRDAGKVIEEVGKGVARLQIVEERLYRHPRACEDGCAPEDLGITNH
jgi:hypothetical protein